MCGVSFPKHYPLDSSTFVNEPLDQFSGLAIRMACDLNLQRQTTVSLPEHVSKDAQARFNVEVMNRERAWLHCFVTDRRFVYSPVSFIPLFLFVDFVSVGVASIATQMGKPGCIPKEDLIVRSAKRWSLKPGSQQSDVDVSAIVEMHRVVVRSIHLSPGALLTTEAPEWRRAGYYLFFILIPTMGQRGRKMSTSESRQLLGTNRHASLTVSDRACSPVLTEMFLGLLEQWHDEWVTPNTSIGSTLREFYYW